eukprot:5410196-Prymnesium_polylepis.1
MTGVLPITSCTMHVPSKSVASTTRRNMAGRRASRGRTQCAKSAAVPSTLRTPSCALKTWPFSRASQRGHTAPTGLPGNSAGIVRVSPCTSLPQNLVPQPLQYCATPPGALASEASPRVRMRRNGCDCTDRTAAEINGVRLWPAGRMRLAMSSCLLYTSDAADDM